MQRRTIEIRAENNYFICRQLIRIFYIAKNSPQKTESFLFLDSVK